MRIDFSEGQGSASLVGTRKIVHDGMHIGAVIDDETGAFVVGPLVYDRKGDWPLGDVASHIRSGDLRFVDSLSDGAYNAANSIVQAVADVLGLEVRRG